VTISPELVALCALAVSAALVGVEVAQTARAAPRLQKKRGRGMADFLLYRRLVGERRDAISLANGGYLASFEVDAPDAAAFTDVELVTADQGIGRALGAISERFIVHFRERHEAVHEYAAPRGRGYFHPLLAWLDARRRAVFESGATSRTRRVLHLAWLPPTGTVARFARAGTLRPDAEAGSEEDPREAFERELAAATSFLRSYAILRRLGIRRDVIDGVAVECSEQLEALAQAINGRRARRAVPVTLQALNSALSEPMRGGADVRVGESEVALVVVKDFPRETEPLALARLRQLTADYDLCVRWMPLTAAESRKLLSAARAEWRSVETEGGFGDPFAEEMIEDSRSAAGMIRERVRFGLMTTTVVLRAPDRRSADSLALAALAIFDELGWSAFVASDTAEEDFYATLPGDGYHGIRGYQLHALNLAHTASLHEQSPGSERLGIPYLPRDAPAMVYAASGKDAARYGHTFATQPADVLHHLGVGGTGLGKSTTLVFLLASWLARVPDAGATLIDSGGSSYRFARFLGVPYYRLLGDNAPRLALFSDLSDLESRLAVSEILVAMCQGQRVVVTPPRRETLERALAAIATYPPPLRSLTAFVEMLQDPEDVLASALRLFTRSGPLGGTLDGETDTFDVQRFTAIDLGAVWGMDAGFLMPVLRALFWKIRVGIRRQREAAGNPTMPWLIELDEAHKPLGNAQGQSFIFDVLKMGRREKFGLGLWSNAAREFATSPILNDMLEACKTRYYFRNLDVVSSDEVRGYYAALNLPENGIAMLPLLERNRILVHQPTIRELAELDWLLDPATLAVIGRTAEAQNDWLDGMIERFPDTWRAEVLRAEGVPEAIIDELGWFNRYYSGAVSAAGEPAAV
jgi:type IV secretion system protein TrbE